MLRAGGVVGFGALLAACSSGRAGGVERRRLGSQFVVTSSSAAISGSGSATRSGSPRPVVLDDATTQTLDALFDKTFAATGLAGMAAGSVDRIGRLDAIGGLRRPGRVRHPSGRPITSGSPASPSPTRPRRCLRLVDQQRLALTDTLESFVPGVANGQQITIKNLLGMTSGIYDFTSDDAFLAAFDADPTMAWSDADTLAVIARHDPLFAPGAEVSYCDSNYALLGMVIAKVTGKPAGEFITTEVIDKLSLPNTSYPTDTDDSRPASDRVCPAGHRSECAIRQRRLSAQDCHRAESRRSIHGRRDDLHSRGSAHLGR